MSQEIPMCYIAPSCYRCTERHTCEDFIKWLSREQQDYRDDA